METKQGVKEVTGNWVDVEEPFWFSIEAKRVQEPGAFGLGAQFPSAVELRMTVSQKRTMMFELMGLGTVITILGPAE